MNNKFLLKLDCVKKYYPIYSSVLQRIINYKKVLENVSFSMLEGEVNGILGESGSGKTTIAKLITRRELCDAGKIIFPDGEIKQLSTKSMAKNVQMVFQNPYSALNPKHKIEFILKERIVQYYKLNNINFTERVIKEQISELLEMVKLPEDILSKYPLELSGGQRQRVAILAAVVLKPRLVILDEPLSSLDISLQAQILNYLSEIKKKYRLSYLFITHDRNLAEYFCDKIFVLREGVLNENN